MTHGPAALPCKVCGAAALFLDSCDFNAHCERAASPRLLPPSGVAVPYYRCPHCGFMFTQFMDGFSPRDFAERVYNPDYRLVDPDFEERRPAALAAYLLNHFGTLPLALCDYGGGSGRMARAINAAQRGLRATHWDPFFSHAPKPVGKFALVTAFEVFEHSPTPAPTLADMLSMTDANRLVLISTLCQPADIGTQRTGWWYCAPRNGHISLHTCDSLECLADDAGIGVTHLDSAIHLFHDTLPDWLRPFLRAHGVGRSGA